MNLQLSLLTQVIWLQTDIASNQHPTTKRTERQMRKKHEHQPDKNKHDQQIHYRGKLRRIVEPLEVGAFRYIHAIPQGKLQ